MLWNQYEVKYKLYLSVRLQVIQSVLLCQFNMYQKVFPGVQNVCLILK